MDPVLLGMIKGLQGDLNVSLNSVLSGVNDYEVDGLNLVIKLKDGGERVMEFDQPNFNDVKLEKGADDEAHLIVSLEDGTKFDAGIIPAGKSAYDLAVEILNFEGTEAEWLATLPGRRDPVKHIFETPSTQWKLQHNMNDQYARIMVYDQDGDEIANPEIDRVSPNLAYINFDIPVSGFVIVS